MSGYRKLPELLATLEGERGQSTRRYYEDYAGRIAASPGSSRNHQAWPGGYVGHIEEVMNFAIRLYETATVFRPVPFSLDSALLVLAWHDAEKPWKYVTEARAETLTMTENMLQGMASMSLRTKLGRSEFRHALLRLYGVHLSPAEANALAYVEGEGEDYSPDGPVMGPLAAFCHMCDVASARLWPEDPRPSAETVQ